MIVKGDNGIIVTAKSRKEVSHPLLVGGPRKKESNRHKPSIIKFGW